MVNCGAWSDQELCCGVENQITKAREKSRIELEEQENKLTKASYRSQNVPE